MEKKHRSESLIKKSVPLWSVVVIFLIFSGITVALAVQVFPGARISIWSSDVPESEFIVTSLDIKMKGTNKIEVSVTVYNNDDTNHSANVTIQLLNENGDMIMEDNKDTGDVPGRGSKEFSKDEKYSFERNGLISEFESVLIVIKDLT